MLDITTIEDGKDLPVESVIVPKAANVLSIQLGDLEYAQTFGVDLRYFLETGLQFQNESFKAYLVDRLTQSQVNVSDVLTLVETFSEKYTFFVGDNRILEGFIR